MPFGLHISVVYIVGPGFELLVCSMLVMIFYLNGEYRNWPQWIFILPSNRQGAVSFIFQHPLREREGVVGGWRNKSKGVIFGQEN